VLPKGLLCQHGARIQREAAEESAAGAVFVKNWDLMVNETNSTLRRLETQVLVRDNNGSVYGVTYKWRAHNSDADLLSSSLSEDIAITNATGVRTQTWSYPSPADCQECHNTAVAGNSFGIGVLDVNARELNGNLTYPATSVTDNQIRTLNRLGLLYPAINETNAAIYYTLDGSLPATNSLLYSAPFNLTNSATVSASAFETNYVNSVAASALFLLQPVRFSSETFSNGLFQLQFIGAAGSNYVLQASTNLVNWTPMATNAATTNGIIFVDPNSGNYPDRFYRAIQQ
jgi:hypothetical protein